MKCDFCDKKAIGYVSMQAAIYCGEHQTKAEEIESLMWAEHDKVQHETMNADHDRIVAELLAEVEELKRTERVYFMNRDWIATAKETIATQAREIEVLKVIANEAEAWRKACAAQVVNQDEVNGHRQKMFLALNKYFYPELAALTKFEKEEGDDEPLRGES